jgi:hypothetical protein
LSPFAADAETIARLLLVIFRRRSTAPNPLSAISTRWLDPEVDAHAEAASARGIDETDLETPTAEATIELVLSSTARGGKAALLLLLVATPLVAADVAMLDRSIAGCDAGKNNEKREILNRFLRFYVPSFFSLPDSNFLNFVFFSSSCSLQLHYQLATAGSTTTLSPAVASRLAPSSSTAR